MQIAIAAALIAGLLACWIIPLRLRLEGSWHTFGFVGDEYLYAQRLQPLIPGTTATNPVNGICDERVISAFYLEDAIRAALGFAKIHIIDAIWMQRFVFPVLMAALLLGLARECLPRTGRTWSKGLRWSAAVLALPLLYCTYDAVTRFPPLQGFLHRFPTNFEFPLSIMLAWSFIRFLKSPGIGRGALLACCSVVAVYIRPFLVVPWSMTIIPAVLYMLFSNVPALRLSTLEGTAKAGLKVCLIMAAILAAGLLPLILIARWNSQFAAQQELYLRWFNLPHTYQIHGKWWFYLLWSFAFWKVSRYVAEELRVFLAGASMAMALLPFVCGAFVFANEILYFDRFGSFYLIVGICALLMLAGEWSRSLRGRAGEVKARRATWGATGACVLLAGVLGTRNYVYDFARYPAGPLPSIAADLQYLDAYRWAAEKTPADALFIVDDGYDWSKAPKDKATFDALLRKFTVKEDLFQLVSRRRRVFIERLFGAAMTTEELFALTMLQRGTLGLEVGDEVYARALARYKPNYILWRKTAPIPISEMVAPVPRGRGARLPGKKVYSDSVCEIWTIEAP